MTLNLDKSSWRRIAFGEVVRNVNETVRDAEAAGLSRIIAMEHLDPGELKVDHWGSTADGTTFTRRVRPGQTLFGKRRAYQRKVAFAEFDAICSGDILTFEAETDQLLPEFLPFLCQSDEFFAHALGTSAGSLSPRTNWRDLSTFEFDLPPLYEQKRLADLLWAVEDHLLSVAGSVATSVDLKSTLLAERLKRGIRSEGWAEESVAELVSSGPTNGKSSPANDETRGIPTLSISAVRGGTIVGGDAVKWVDAVAEQVTPFRLRENDFLVVRGNGNRSLTGLGGLVTGGLPEGCIFPDLLIRLRFDESRLLPAFAAEQWNNEAAHSALLANAKSTNGIWKINGKDIKSHRLVVPPLESQRELLEELTALGNVQNSASLESQTLDNLRFAILAEVFGGNS